MTDYEFVFQIVHDLGKVAPLLRVTDEYLRHRSNCPAAASFRRGIEILDQIELKGCEYLQNKINGKKEKEKKNG